MNNEPAFPTVEYKQPAYGGAHVMTINGGMQLRDYFAAKAMQGWLASYPENMDAETAELGANSAAKMAYRMADAMLAAREVK